MATYGSDAFGASTYGGISGNPISGEVASSGAVSFTRFQSISGTISTSGISDPKPLQFLASTSGSIASSSSATFKINKALYGAIAPSSPMVASYGGQFDTSTNIGKNPYANYTDALIKKTITSLASSLSMSGALSSGKRFKSGYSGSNTPAGSVSTVLRVLLTKSIAGSISSSSDIDANVEDPNDINVLIRKPAQKVLPRVKAYWSSGKFTENLLGFSSSDVYQKKTKDLDPVFYWTFDNVDPGSATSTVSNTLIVDDAGQNNFDGVIAGALIGGTSGALRGPDEESTSISLLGSSYISLPSNTSINLVDNFQIEAWVYMSSTPAAESFIVSKGIGQNNIDKQYGISIDTNRKVRGYAWSGTSEFLAQGDTILALNTWHHLILTIENQKVYVIVNGIKDSVSINIGNDLNITNGSLEVGRLAASGYYFSGKIDEVAFYNRVIFSGSGSAYARYRSGFNAGTYNLDDKFYPEQIMNGHKRVAFTWGVSDTNKLNGLPVTANGETYAMEGDDSFRYEHGWWSRSLSDSVGRMPFIESVVCEFDEHPATEIDVYTSEFFAGAKEIDVYYRNSNKEWISLRSGVVLAKDSYVSTMSITTSEAPIYITGIRVDILSIWAGNDIARIEEVDPVYITDISNDIIGFDIDTSREEFDSNIPIGTASANSVNITLNNTDLLYSFYNSNSPYFGLVLPDVKFEIEVGWSAPDGYQYKSLGTYWADQWQESSDAMSVTVNARDYSKFAQETTTTGDVWLDIDGAEAIANLLKTVNFPAYDIVTDIPYNRLANNYSAAGLWMLHENNFNQYALSWTSEAKLQYAIGNIEHGPEGDFTFSTWINTSERSGIRTIAHFFASTSNYIHIYNPKSLTIDISGSVGYFNTDIADGNWHNIAIAWQRSGSASLFVDGKLISTINVGSGKNLTKQYSLTLGIYQTARGIVPTYYDTNKSTIAMDNQFIGMMSRHSLWSFAMTQSEVRDRLFRELLPMEENILFNMPYTINTFDNTGDRRFIYSSSLAGDRLRVINLSIVETGYMNAVDLANYSNGLLFGNYTLSNSDSAFALEPYNKSLLLSGDDTIGFAFSGNTNCYIYTPKTARIIIQDDIEVIMRLSLQTFTPSTTQTLYAQYKSSNNNRSLAFNLNTDGTLGLLYSTNGTSDTTVATSKLLQSCNIRPSQKFYIKFIHKVDNGSSGNDFSVYVSTDEIENISAVTWTLLETVTTSGVVSRYGSAADISVGATNDDANRLIGSIYRVVVNKGIDSLDTRIDLRGTDPKIQTAASFIDSTFNTWNVLSSKIITGYGSYMLIPGSDQLDVLDGSFSIAFWINPEENEDYIILAKEYFGSSTEKTFAVALNSNGGVSVYSRNGSAWNPSYPYAYGEMIRSKNNIITNNQWNFIFIAYDIDTKKINICVNGESVASAVMSSGFNSNTNPWLLGSDGSATYFMGSGAYINGLAIFDYNLSDFQCDRLYKSGASLVNHSFPAIWTEDGESVWDAMLAVGTGDLGTFYFDSDNMFIYTSSLNNYNSAFKQFSETQFELSDNTNIVSATQSIALQTNKVIINVSPVPDDFNKKESLWTAPDGLQLVGGTLASDITSNTTGYLVYNSKIITEGSETFRVPVWNPTGYIKIDDEIIYYGSRDDNKLYDLRRAQFDTNAVDHLAGARVREARAFKIEYSNKPSIVLDDPFCTAVINDKTVDIDIWKPDAFGALLVISRNTNGDEFLRQYIQRSDPLNNIDNFLSISGTPLGSTSGSGEKQEYESASYTNSIRRYGIKSVEVSNRFITNTSTAKQFSDYLIKHFYSPVPTMEVAILGNPMIKLGDRVSIVTFNRMGMSHEDFWVESNRISYRGGIEQQLVLRKVA